MGTNQMHSLLNSVGKIEFIQALETWFKDGTVTADDIVANATADNREVSGSSAQTKASAFNKIIKEGWQAEALQECCTNKSNANSARRARELFEKHFSSQGNAKLHQLWNEFLTKWPAENLKTMTYEQYSKAGSYDSFCYWLEAKTTDLGSIWGSSSFKFGVYSRKDTEFKESKGGYSYTATDAWLTRNGSSVEEAFQNVKSHILKIVDCVQNKRLDEIDSIPFADMVKWKIAFLYQPRDAIEVVSVFKKDWLQSYLGEKSTTPISALHKRIVAENPGVDVFELSRRIWSRFTEAQADGEELSTPRTPRNIILYGPPGTGKTYSLQFGKIEALSFLKGLPEEQTQFVTFHPSYSYEDFVEGITPVLDDESGLLRYTKKDGVLKKIANLARSDSTQSKSKIKVRGVNKWKMSLGDTSTQDGNLVFEACMDEGLALFGFIEADVSAHISNATTLNNFLKSLPVESSTVSVMMRQFAVEMDIGDIILVSKGNAGGIRAIGQVAGPYEYQFDLPEKYGFNGAYIHARKVKWLWYNNENPIPVEKLLKRGVTQRTIYSINQNIKEDELINIIGVGSPGKTKKYILKIDEINRGNVAKIFGELITLIEDDKRGKIITLASGEPFSVPENLFIIGTMNTADRSLTHLDTALRRRFHFIEMPPNPLILENQKIGDIDLTVLLARMNDRIESLLGREQTLGHAYFMQKGKPISDEQSFAWIIINKVLPQLQEYFFDDYGQIQKILGNGLIIKKNLNKLPKEYSQREVFIVDQLDPKELVTALAVEYGFPQGQEQ